MTRIKTYKGGAKRKSTATNIQNRTSTGKIAVASGGGVHAKLLAQQVNGVLLPLTHFQKTRADYDTLIVLYAYPPLKLRRLLEILTLNPHMKLILWWIGSDVYHLVHEAQPKVVFTKIASHRRIVNLSVSTDNWAELDANGVKSSVLTLVPHTSTLDKLPLPDDYTVCVYMPSSRLDFFCWKSTKRIMRATPEIQYLIYGNKNRLDLRGLRNATTLGWVDNTTDVFRQSSCLLRLTEHDGFPKSIIESVCHGRYVVTNHNYPQIQSMNNEKAIIELLKMKPMLDDFSQSFYKKNYNEHKIAKDLRSIALKKPKKAAQRVRGKSCQRRRRSQNLPKAAPVVCTTRVSQVRTVRRR